MLTCPGGQVATQRSTGVNSKMQPPGLSLRTIRSSYRFAGACDLPATRPDGSKKPFEPLPEILTRQPGRVHQSKIVHPSQFSFETIKQFLRSVVQL